MHILETIINHKCSDGSSGSIALSKTGHLVQVEDKKWTIILDALLVGHEDWIHSVCWHPPVLVNDKWHQPLQLLSASMDRTMMIWSPEKSGVWINSAQMGEFGGLTGLFGQLGYFGAYFGNQGNLIMANGYNGSFHKWKLESSTCAFKHSFFLNQFNSIFVDEWKPKFSISGHFGPVMDASWDPAQNYFITVSQDQTTRLFAPWVHKQNEWHEIGRPQIHGYDMSCLTFINQREHAIVSGADEKVLRVFEAPTVFIETIENISGVKSNTEVARPKYASVPALGLSNKAIKEGEQDIQVKDEFLVNYGDDEGGEGGLDEADGSNTSFNPVALEQPPFEEHLLQNTLWPEVQKLYGHADELVAVTCNNSGTIIASACSAKTAETAQVRLWNVKTWREIEALGGHTLTVTQIAFSPNDDYMLSVSRDRNMILYKISDDRSTYKPVVQHVNAHKRIIWGCSFSSDGSYFATGSRDEQVKIWAGKIVNDKIPLVCTLPFENRPVTAVEFVPMLNDGSVESGNVDLKYLLAIGFEDGQIELYAPQVGGTKWQLYLALPFADVHSESVRRLRFRWLKNEKAKLQLVTCSTDYSVRLFDIYI